VTTTNSSQEVKILLESLPFDLQTPLTNTRSCAHNRDRMAFIRVKRHGTREYYYLVEGKREGKKVRQKVIKYLGTEPPTKEQIESMRRER